MRAAKIRPDLRLTFLGPLDMSPVDRAGSVTGMNFALGSYELILARFPR